MNQHAYRKSFVVGTVAIGTIAGVAIGFFTAHRMMGDMAGMTMETGVVLAAPGRAGEMGDMKQMDMKGMPMEGTMSMKDMGPMGKAGASAPVYGTQQ